MWNCVSCNTENNDKHDFCIECGLPKPKPSTNHCSNPNCQAYNEVLPNSKQKHCGYCGAATTYTGTYVPENAEASLSDDITCAIFKSIDMNARKICNNTHGSILLMDAAMTTSSGINSSFKYLRVFTDEVIALSIGGIDQN